MCIASRAVSGSASRFLTTLSSPWKKHELEKLRIFRACFHRLRLSGLLLQSVELAGFVKHNQGLRDPGNAFALLHLLLRSRLQSGLSLVCCIIADKLEFVCIIHLSCCSGGDKRVLLIVQRGETTWYFLVNDDTATCLNRP